MCALAGSPVCSFETVCSLPTHSHNTCRWCNCSQCQCVKASYKCQGIQLTNVVHICDISVWECLACDCFIKKNCSDALLCLASASNGTPTNHPINPYSSLLVDCCAYCPQKYFLDLASSNLIKRNVISVLCSERNNDYRIYTHFPIFLVCVFCLNCRNVYIVVIVI